MKQQNIIKQENTIRVERAKRGLTQSQLANKIGISYQALGEIERGKSDPKLRTAFKLARLFNKKISEVFKLK